MNIDEEKNSLNNIIIHGITGGHEELANFRTLVYPIEKYEIVVRLSPEGYFIGIDEVRICKSFIDNRKLSLSGEYHDVDEFYKE